VERALDLAHLAEALGLHAPLPSPEELQQLLADAEVALFSQQPSISDELLLTAWSLHAVASSDPSYETYSTERQRRAFQVSAHIFDLALAGGGRPRAERLRLAFAAEIGYRRGELDPNATAVYVATKSLFETGRPLLEHIDTVAVEAGAALLGYQPGDLFKTLRGWREQFNRLRERLRIASMAPTIFGPASLVVEGAWQMLRFLVFGSEPALRAAREALDAALEIRPQLTDLPGALDDLDARWVAAHLRRLADDIDEGSIWRVLPPDVPSGARQALALSPPPVLTLWQPQRELLLQDTEHSPMAPESRRLVLSVPTSAGKTLLAQLFILAHLATAYGSVCYVTPMRSLARELRRAMSGRLRILEKELGRDVPDWFFGGLTPEDLTELKPDLDVMTPERLSNLLRHDPDAVLDKYSLFIFDEAQLVGERGRGFLMEQVLSFLHWRTRDEAGKIILLSAALGNKGQLAQWLRTTEGPARLFESDWRGPRRLHALFNTTVDWDTERRERVRSVKNPWRVYHPMIGSIRLRPSNAGRVVRLRLGEEVGEIAFRESSPGVRVGGRESSHTTPFYKAVADLVGVIGQAGPVLTVTSTRSAATRMARAVAAQLNDQQRSVLLGDFVRRRLGEDHPLTDLVTRGVAFHHAALPVDVLEGIEDAFRAGVLRHVVCTSTLTEGVNLPARAVVLAETRYEGQPADALLTGARLVNAIGRAGRAGKETEGWVILALHSQEQVEDFRVLNPQDDELKVNSQLATAHALEALSQFELRVAQGEDAVFSDAAESMNGFISFVWFLLAAEEGRARAPNEAELQGALQATLGFAQLPPAARDRWSRVAESVRASYARTAPDRRRRWSESGTSINSAREIERIAKGLAAAAADVEDRGNLDTALRLVAQEKVLERLLALSEAPGRWRFKTARGGPVHEVTVPPGSFVRAWLAGQGPSEMADYFLTDVTSRDFAVEQVVDATAEHFEHYLAWTLGAVIDQANRVLNEEPLLCPSLSLYVRYGVSSMLAVELLTRGVRSRALAVVIASAAGLDGVAAPHLTAWLGKLSIPEWRDRFGATPGDVVDLLQLIRSGRASAVRELLEDEAASFEAPTSAQQMEVDVRSLDSVGLAGPLGVFRAGSEARLGVVPSPLHADVQALLDTGMVSRITIDSQGLHFAAEIAE